MALVPEPTYQISPVNVGQFRTLLAAFQDSSVYADDAIEFYLQEAVNNLNARRWGSLYRQGIIYYTAHFLTMDRIAARSAAAGGSPGGQVGQVTNKSVGNVSVGYDTGSVTETDGGHWNNTNYGIRFLYYARMVGAGGVQVSGAPIGAILPGIANPWPN